MRHLMSPMDLSVAELEELMKLAAKIEEAMRRCGYNQTQFARLMKKSTTVISEWLSGDRNFTADTLMEIEEALGIRLLDISIMTAVSAGTEISQKSSANFGGAATMSLQGTWNISESHGEPECYINCA